MELIAKKRNELGKKTRKLRRDFLIPGVIYGSKMESEPVTVDLVQFTKIYQQAGETNLVELRVDGEKSVKVLIDEVQTHHVTDEPIHVNFHKVNLKEKITADIPVEVIGEEVSPILKSGDGVLLILKQEIEIEALPTDLIDSFVIDVSEVTEIGKAFTMADLSFDKEKIEIVDFDPEEPIVKIDYATMEEAAEEVDEEAAMESLEATQEKAKDKEEDS